MSFVYLGEDVLRDCGISWVSSLVFFESVRGHLAKRGITLEALGIPV